MAPLLEERDLFPVEIRTAGKRIEVFIDGVPNVLIDDCADISRALQERLDAEPGVPEDYRLDVSSPGMSNPLKVPAQFRKRVGQALWLTVDGAEILVRLLDADDDGIRFVRSRVKTSKNKAIKPKVVEKEGAEPETLTYDRIGKAVLYFNF